MDPLDDAPGPAGRGDQREAGARPRSYAAVEILRLEPIRPKTEGGAVAARAGAAHGDDHPLTRYLREARSELAERDVLRALDVPGVPLVLLADV